MRILLNIIKKDNFVFFDPVNKVHLNRVHPLGEVSILSDSLKRAFKTNAVIDVDNSFDLEISEKNRKLNEDIIKYLHITTLKKEEVIEEAIEKVTEEVAEEVKPKPKQRKKKS